MQQGNSKAISIILPVYNVERYLRESLNSILAQTMSNFELICVNDASTDASLNILKEYSLKDKRIIIVDKKHNEGLGYARNSGIEHATTDYIMFVDSDDYIAANAVEKIINSISKNPNADMIAFGVNLIYETDMRNTDEDRNWYQMKYSGLIELKSEHILSTNVEVWNKVYKKNIIEKYSLKFPKRVYEDVSFLYRYYAACKYVYYLNEGLYYYRQRESSLMHNCLNNDASRLFPGVTVCKELFDFYTQIDRADWYVVILKLFVRHFYYAFNHIKKDQFQPLMDLTIKTFNELDLNYKKYASQLNDDETQFYNNLVQKNYAVFYNYRFNYKDTKILLSYHAPCKLLSSEVMIPINVGRALQREISKDGKLSEDDIKWLNDNMIGDDTGDNISAKNRIYAELTAQYWAWKNLDALGNPEYIGFMHYRRHFMLKLPQHYIDNSPVNHFPYLNDQYLHEIGLDNDQFIRDSIHADGIVYKSFWVDKTVYAQFADLEDTPWELDTTVFDNVLELVKTKYPQYRDSMYEYLGNKQHYWMNMYVFKKELFCEYASWLFDILFTAEKDIDFSKYTVQGRRVLAYIAERLLGIFITYQTQKKKKHFREIPVSLVANVDIPTPVSPSFSKNNIPIVFASDDRYAQYMAVVIQSLIDNSSKNNNYDIFVLDDAITDYNKKLINDMIADYSNFHVTFVNINIYIPESIKKMFYTNNYITPSTYFRFYVERIFSKFDKIIYLDCDVAVTKDITELYAIDLGDKLLGACRDYETLRIALTNSEWHDYLTNTLKIDNVYEYLQAGVLVYNVRAMIQNNIFNKLITRLKEVPEPRFVDQDIISSVLQGQIKIIPPAWNYEWYIEIHEPNLQNILPRKYYNEYSAAKNNYAIIHYNGPMKPWIDPSIPGSEVFWKYARKTPFYEIILKKNEQNFQSISDKLKYLQDCMGSHYDWLRYLENIINNTQESNTTQQQTHKINGNFQAALQHKPEYTKLNHTQYGLDVPLYPNGKLVKFINKVQRWFPMNSKRRTLAKKIVSLFT